MAYSQFLFTVHLPLWHLLFCILLLLSLSFQKFVQDSDDEGSDGHGDSQLLTRRIKTQEEKVRAHEEASRDTCINDILKHQVIREVALPAAFSVNGRELF